MSLSLFLQRLVSGKKRRFRQDGVELDLVYITDRLIIMGLPTSGLESWYRNPRKTVRKFLESRHGRKFHLYNFCPVYENAYDAAYFYNQVSRFPFPDHHPPPLSLIPLFVADITSWASSDPDNVSVIHCKAGKGRSGTMTCCYLLTLSQLPTPASSRSASMDVTNSGSPKEHANLAREGAAEIMHDLNEKAPHPALDRVGTPQTSRANSINSSNTESDPTADPSALEVADIGDKLSYIFDLHTKQRMKPSSKKARGVSIPSQRRFVAYWNSIISGQDYRSLTPSSSQKKFKITSIDVFLQSPTAKLSFLFSKQRISVSVSTYQSEYLRKLRNWERELKTDTNRDYIWNDESDLIQKCDFSFTEQDEKEEETDRPDSLCRRLTLYKHEEGAEVLLDPDQEIQFKVLIGKTGNKHFKLPDYASLGYIWVVPSMEAAGQLRGVWEFDSTEIDFLKDPPVHAVNVAYEMV